jgi:hypothetical protein
MKALYNLYIFCDNSKMGSGIFVHNESHTRLQKPKIKTFVRFSDNYFNILMGAQLSNAILRYL